MSIAFDNSYARDLDGLYVAYEPPAFPDPATVIYNQALADELGLDAEVEAHAATWFGGQAQPEGASPLAMAYAGHQFGGFNPQLGDGRAYLMGEVVAPDGRRVDLHLKGSGRTVFSRGGDGKATLGPVLREYLMGEAMHALGVPTTRALAVVRTGERVPRPTSVRLAARKGEALPDAMHGHEALPGALLVRVASSHLRVGTFEFFAARRDHDKLQRLADYARARHYPEAEDAAELLRAVVHAQAKLVAHWMSLGFVHGVMNTDNCTISGETIDYGPCAFMDAYDPQTVFSSIDQHGRYAYGRQPGIAAWNLARLAEALLPLLADDESAAIAQAEAVLGDYGPTYNAAFLGHMRAKLGLDGEAEDDLALVADLLERMLAEGADYTRTFRALADERRGKRLGLLSLFSDTAALDAWLTCWHARLGDADVADRMDAVNPLVIPRNHKVEEALDAAITGDLDPFRALLAAVSDPFTARPGIDAYTQPAPESFGRMVTFCGT
ncbi:MAG: YdiU family protein [Deltaproteobacteria bacterium]|nr:MAG: YdiU family protein [Deltaproteobacteria bacterium]